MSQPLTLKDICEEYSYRHQNLGYINLDGDYVFEPHVVTLFSVLARLPVFVATGRSKPIRVLATAITPIWFLATWVVGVLAFIPGVAVESLIDIVRDIWQATD